MPFNTLFDALRRLPVVIGCVVLATAQPMSGTPSTEPARSPDSETVIYPKGKTADGIGLSASQDIGYGSPVYLVFVVIIAATGGWVLWRKKKGGPFVPGGKGVSKLVLEETKSLGNRQYLVVAAYEGRKFLLGVTTDKIELLTHLPEGGSEE